MRTTLLLLLVAPAAFAATPADLVAKLGDPDFHTRESASKELLALGEQALPELEAGRDSDTPEVAQRCELLLGTVRKKLATDATLAPAMVDLPAGEISVKKLFALLQQQTRYKMTLNGDAAILSEIVTLKGGKVPFWEAVGEICKQTKLGVQGMTTEPYARAGDPAAPLGVVTLLAGGRESGASVKALRIDVAPLAGTELGLWTPNQLPLVVRVTPEPTLRWGGLTEVTLMEAFTPDGTKVGADLTPELLVVPSLEDGLRRRPRRGYYNLDGDRLSGQTRKVVALAAGEQPPTELATVSGIVRGMVWAPVSELAAVKLGDPDADATAEGPHGTTLTAKLLKPRPKFDPPAPIIEVTLRWDASRVRQERVEVASGAGEGVWFENRGGKLVPVKAAEPPKADAKTPAAPTPNEFGYVCSAADGTQLTLSAYGSTVSEVINDGRRYTVRTDKYVVMKERGVLADKPAAVAFHASRVVEVAVPFTVKNVPLARGTGDGSQRIAELDKVLTR